jgi:hypothetical protein
MCQDCDSEDSYYDGYDYWAVGDESDSESNPNRLPPPDPNTWSFVLTDTITGQVMATGVMPPVIAMPGDQINVTWTWRTLPS